MNVHVFAVCETVPGNSIPKIVYCGPDMAEGVREATKASGGKLRIYRQLNPRWDFYNTVKFVPMVLKEETKESKSEPKEPPKEQPKEKTATLRSTLKK